MLNDAEKAVLNTVAGYDGQLKTVQEVANKTDGLNKDEVWTALASLSGEGYVEGMGTHHLHDGTLVLEGPFWTVDQAVSKLRQGGAL